MLLHPNTIIRKSDSLPKYLIPTANWMVRGLMAVVGASCSNHTLGMLRRW